MAKSEMTKVTLIKSLIGTPAKHRLSVHGLGLRKLQHSVVLKKTPEVLGMINKVHYLVKVEDV